MTAYDGLLSLDRMERAVEIDASWPGRYPPELAERLQHLIDTPDG